MWGNMLPISVTWNYHHQRKSFCVKTFFLILFKKKKLSLGVDMSQVKRLAQPAGAVEYTDFISAEC